MRVSLNMIKDRIDPALYTQVYGKKGMETEIKNVKVWDNAITGADPHTIYICNCEQFEYLQSRAENCIAAKASPAALMESIINIILTFQDWDNRLHEAVQSSEPDWYDILDICHEAVNLPLMIRDTSYKTIAYTRNDIINDPAWLESQELGYTGYNSEMGDEAQKMIISLMSDKSDIPAIRRSKVLQYPCYPCKIMSAGNLIGLLFAVKVREVLPSYLELLHYITVNVACVFKERVIGDKNGAFLYSTLMSDLLGKKIATREELNGRLKTLNWNANKYYYVLVMKNSNFLMTQTALSMICDEFSKIGGAKAIPFSGQVVGMLNTDRPDTVLERNMGYIMNILKEHNLVCGVSEYSDDLLEFPVMYNLALAAADYNNSCSGVLREFDSCKLKILLSKLNSIPDLVRYLHPSIATLRKYDKCNRSELLKTLACYLDHCQNQSAAAKALNIHRTTMVYRLDKIKEVTGIDFSDIENTFHIQLSLMLEKRFLDSTM